MGTRSTMMPLWHVIRGGLDWLLYDVFPAPDAAPLTTPRTCDPGPGTLNVTGAAIAIAGGKLVIDADTAAWKGVSSVGRFDPDAGLAIMTDCGATVGTVLGFTFTSASTANADASGYTRHRKDVGNVYKVAGPTAVTVGTWSTGKHVSVLRGANGCHFIRSGKLVWVNDDQANHANNYATIGSYNCTADIESFGALSLPANGYADWAADFSTITDSKTNPANLTAFNCDADCHINTTFTHENTKYVLISARYTDSNNRIYWNATTAGGLVVTEFYLGTPNILLNDAAVFSDGVAAEVDMILEGSAISIYVDNVLKLSDTLGDPTTTTGGLAENTLATNDIVLSTHPYPALGIATDRVIAPQDSEEADCNPDCLIYIRGIELPGSGQNYLFFRGRLFEATPYCYGIWADTNGSIGVREYTSGADPDRIAGGNGTVSNGDDIAIIADGADLTLFVNGTSVGSYGSAIYQSNAGSKNYTNGIVCDSIEFFPRDVSSILPTELV